MQTKIPLSPPLVPRYQIQSAHNEPPVQKPTYCQTYGTKNCLPRNEPERRIAYQQMNSDLKLWLALQNASTDMLLSNIYALNVPVNLILNDIFPKSHEPNDSNKEIPYKLTYTISVQAWTYNILRT
jgi:hypothetical protein